MKELDVVRETVDLMREARCVDREARLRATRCQHSNDEMSKETNLTDSFLSSSISDSNTFMPSNKKLTSEWE